MSSTEPTQIRVQIRLTELFLDDLLKFWQFQKISDKSSSRSWSSWKFMLFSRTHLSIWPSSFPNQTFPGSSSAGLSSSSGWCFLNRPAKVPIVECCSHHLLLENLSFTSLPPAGAPSPLQVDKRSTHLRTSNFQTVRPNIRCIISRLSNCWIDPQTPSRYLVYCLQCEPYFSCPGTINCFGGEIYRGLSSSVMFHYGQNFFLKSNCRIN